MVNSRFPPEKSFITSTTGQKQVFLFFLSSFSDVDVCSVVSLKCSLDQVEALPNVVPRQSTIYISSPEFESYWQKNDEGSGCGSVGRAVASDSRCPQFESSHRQNLIQNKFYC